MLVLILGLSKMTGNTAPESPALEDIEVAPAQQPVAPQE
jgi:preprotein translocase subunit SecG